MEEYREHFSKQLAKYLGEKEMSYSDLANRLGINKSVVSSWKSGARYPRMNTMTHIAEILDCQISDLIQIQNTTESKTAHPVSAENDDETAALRKYRRLSPEGRQYIQDQLDFRLGLEAKKTGRS